MVDDLSSKILDRSKKGNFSPGANFADRFGGTTGVPLGPTREAKGDLGKPYAPQQLVYDRHQILYLKTLSELSTPAFERHRSAAESERQNRDKHQLGLPHDIRRPGVR
jgi:hypothetical protein